MHRKLQDTAAKTRKQKATAVRNGLKRETVRLYHLATSKVRNPGAPARQTYSLQPAAASTAQPPLPTRRLSGGSSEALDRSTRLCDLLGFSWMNRCYDEMRSFCGGRSPRQDVSGCGRPP